VNSADPVLDRIREINSDIVIRPATQSDGQDFIDLMNRQYRRKKTIDYFAWQYTNPAVRTALFLAVHKERLVGCYGIILESMSTDVTCGFMMDLIIEPEYRNRGLFLLMEHEASTFALSEGAVAMAVLPNLDGRDAHVRVPRWRQVGIIKTLTAIPDQLAQRTSIAPEEAGELVYFSKSPEYRRWRFDSNPVYTYSRIGDGRDAFAVAKVFVDPVTHTAFGDIVDIECNLSESRNIERVLVQACEFLKSKNVSEITLWGLPHTPTGKVARAMGFRESEQERYFCVKILKAGFEHLRDFHRWHLVEADSEIY
jgi:hypothetical protein